ncbi:MAG: Cold-shock DNA-binding domain protein [Syntrophorhabdus sp. PtaU1.Bin153]|nr:MAG: Cold-shock DNA-binding domain protein [Syntrophorhabdus sp. PtaU1.Bin153]
MASSPVFEAVNKIKDLFGSDGTTVFSYANELHFRDLWESLSRTKEELVGWCEERRNVIVVFDGLPKGSPISNRINLAAYLTPIDWAAVFSLSIVDKFKGSNYPDLRIFIVDSGLLSISLTSGTAGILELFNKCDLKHMPWIRTFYPGDEKQTWDFENFLLNIALTSHLPSSGPLICDHSFTGAVPSMGAALAEKGPNLDHIRNLWMANLTRPSIPDDHHSIANVIGPLLLSKTKDDDPRLYALQNLLTELRLLPNEKDADGLLPDESWIEKDSEPWKSIFDQIVGHEHKLNLVLVDDMFELGWGRIVCEAFGEEYQPKSSSGDLLRINKNDESRIIVKASSSPAGLIETIRAFLEKDDSESDCRFRFTVDRDNERTAFPEILLIDLRLFSGKESDELQHFSDVKDVAKALMRRKNLGWDRITDDEMIEVEKWISDPNRSKDSPGYAACLTLLPRLVALIDFSLPIVLFSSTGRRDIVNKVLPYKNIITVFDKPRITAAISGQIAAETRDKFQNAMKKAFEILKARQKCRNIARFYKPDVNEFNSSAVHVELFLDESFSNPVTQDLVYVGGPFAIFESNSLEDARRKADQFDDDLVVAGVRYFESFEVGAQSIKPPKNKKDDSSADLLKAMETSDNKPNHLGFVRLSHTFGAPKSSREFLDTHSGDNLFRQTLQTLLELFLFETLPHLLGEEVAERAQISVFAGTRVKDFAHSLIGSRELARAEYQFGYKSRDVGTKHLLYTIDRPSVSSMVNDILVFHSARKRSIDRAIGVQLPYADSKTVEYPEFFVCRNCNKVIAKKSIDPGKDVIDVPVLRNYGSTKRVGIVDGFSKKMDYGFITTVGASKRVFAHVSQWPSIVSATKGDLVKFEPILNEKGLQAQEVESVSATTIVDYRKALKEFCLCGFCDTIVPDYRALHYIADEILDPSHFLAVLNGTDGYGKSIERFSGCFDDEITEDMRSTIQASRLLDQGDKVGAISTVRVAEQDAATPLRAKSLLLQRIASSLSDLRGDDFMRIVSRSDQL